MGDKGGRKDKEKNKQQHAKKHSDEAQRKNDKTRPTGAPVTTQR